MSGKLSESNLRGLIQLGCSSGQTAHDAMREGLEWAGYPKETHGRFYLGFWHSEPQPGEVRIGAVKVRSGDPSLPIFDRHPDEVTRQWAEDWVKALGCERKKWIG